MALCFQAPFQGTVPSQLGSNSSMGQSHIDAGCRHWDSLVGVGSCSGCSRQAASHAIQHAGHRLWTLAGNQLKGALQRHVTVILHGPSDLTRESRRDCAGLASYPEACSIEAEDAKSGTQGRHTAQGCTRWLPNRLRCQLLPSLGCQLS